MVRKLIKSIVGLVSAVSLGLLGVTAHLSASLPDHFYVQQGETLTLNTKLDITTEELSQSGTLREAAQSQTKSNVVEFKLFGLIPIKESRVDVMSETVLVPCGTPFGIKMFTEGVLVVGINTIETASGSANPAKEAGIRIGDTILAINGKSVGSNEDVAKIVSECGGKKISLSMKRKTMAFQTELQPVLSSADGQYKAGLWVRDSSAGIGTVTFYNPATASFGGLGHPICDVDTGEILPLMAGEVVDVNINGYKKGVAGTPGELVGSFTSEKSSGTILTNTECGVYGVLYNNPSSHQALPVAMRQEIKTGPATILTTIKGTEPKEYDIEIEKISLNGDNLSKNMVIKITDPELLKTTGGIVQGMSGSPILQNGKIVGAVTHVFVNEPNKGYGIFIENMINYAKKVDSMQQKVAS